MLLNKLLFHTHLSESQKKEVRKLYFHTQWEAEDIFRSMSKSPYPELYALVPIEGKERFKHEAYKLARLDRMASEKMKRILPNEDEMLVKIFGSEHPLSLNSSHFQDLERWEALAMEARSEANQRLWFQDGRGLDGNTRMPFE